MKQFTVRFLKNGKKETINYDGMTDIAIRRVFLDEHFDILDKDIISVTENSSKHCGIKVKKIPGSNKVIITDINIPFAKLIMIMVKVGIASIPAMIILLIIGFFVSAMLAGGIGL
jgi:hypothetical protein